MKENQFMKNENELSERERKIKKNSVYILIYFF